MAQRRVLFITYYFPPSGGSGVQRPLKFIKYLQDFGWMPVVLTVDPDYASYPGNDPHMASEIPDNVSVHRTRSWDPYRLYASLSNKKKTDVVSVGFVSGEKIGWKERLARWVRGNVFIPDARAGWVPYGKKKGRTILETEAIDAIITTGPPHSTHLIGKQLKKAFDVPWIADMRDPWTTVFFAQQLPMSPPARALNNRMEQSVLDQADVVVTATPSMQEEFQPKTQTPCVTIYNGFDRADFTSPSPAQSNTFTLAFMGNWMADQNAPVFWETLATLYQTKSLQELRMLFIGNIDQHVMQHIEQAGLRHLVEHTGYLPHNEALDKLKQGSAVLLPINQGPAGKGIVTGKLFEYMASGIPILGIGPTDGDAADILARTGAGFMIDYADTAAFRDTLTRLYDAWKKGNTVIQPDEQAIASFDRKYQTGQLARLLDKAISGDL